MAEMKTCRTKARNAYLQCLMDVNMSEEGSRKCRGVYDGSLSACGDAADKPTQSIQASAGSGKPNDTAPAPTPTTEPSLK